MAPRELVALIAYVAPDVKAELRQLAREHDRTLSQQTHRALREHLAQQHAEHARAGTGARGTVG